MHVVYTQQLKFDISGTAWPVLQEYYAFPEEIWNQPSDRTGEY